MPVLKRSVPMLWILVWVLLPLALSPADADTVTLNSSEVLEGRILSETDTQIVMEASFYHGTILATRELLKSNIRSIVRGPAEPKAEKAAPDPAQSLKQQLADLQRQRAAQAEKLAVTQKQLSDAQSRLAKIPDAAGSGSAANQSGRHDLAGRLTAGVVGASQAENAGESVSSPDRSQVQGEISSYQQQVKQQQAALTALDAKIVEVQSQVSASVVPAPPSSLSATNPTATPTKSLPASQ